MLNKNAVAVTVGVFLAIVHAAWALMVWMGLAQKIVNWVTTVHMVQMRVVVNSFDVGLAVKLLILTFVGGYVFGWVFAWTWNRFRKV